MTTRKISGIFLFLVIIAASPVLAVEESPALLQTENIIPLPFYGPGENLFYSLHVTDNAQLVILNSRNGPDLFAYDGNGSFLWNRTLSSEQPPWISSISIGPGAQDLILTQMVPACCHGSVTNTSSNKVIFLDKNGTKMGEYPTMNPPLASAISSSGQDFFIGTEDGRILCLNPGGTLRWTIRIEAPVTSFAVSRDGNTLVATGESNYNFHDLYNEPLNPVDLIVLDQNGTVLWDYQTGGLNSATVSDDGSVIAVLEKRSGTMLVFNRSGSRIAKRLLGGAASALSMTGDGNLIVAKTTAGTVYGMNRTGATLWTIPVDPGSSGLGFINKENSLVLGDGQSVALYDLQGILIEKYPAGGQIQVIAPAGDALSVVAGTDHSLVFFSARLQKKDAGISAGAPLMTTPTSAASSQVPTKASVSPCILVFALACSVLGMTALGKWQR